MPELREAAVKQLYEQIARLLQLAEETALHHEADKHEARGERHLIEVKLLRQTARVRRMLTRPCQEHGVLAVDHCAEMERMLQEVPGDFCEGEGDAPNEAVKRLRLAYEELQLERVDG